MKEQAAIILIHGAWHGGWCWTEVAERLEVAGYRVFCPTLPGLAERAAECAHLTGLSSHITEITDMIASEAGQRFILVGHSCAGFILEAVAEHLSAIGGQDQIERLIFLDAILAEDGMSYADMMEPVGRERMIATAHDNALPPIAVRYFGLRPEQTTEIARLQSRLTAHPLNCLTDAVSLPHGGAKPYRCDYIACIDPVFGTVTEQATQKAIARDWPVHLLACGHDAMLANPDALAAMILDIAGADI